MIFIPFSLYNILQQHQSHSEGMSPNHLGTTIEYVKMKPMQRLRCGSFDSGKPLFSIQLNSFYGDVRSWPEVLCQMSDLLVCIDILRAKSRDDLSLGIPLQSHK